MRSTPLSSWAGWRTASCTFCFVSRFYAALRAAKLKRIRFHDLRHTFGTLAAQKFPLTSVQAMLGHAHINTTMIYAHYVPAADEAALLGQAFRTGVMAAAKVAA